MPRREPRIKVKGFYIYPSTIIALFVLIVASACTLIKPATPDQSAKGWYVAINTMRTPEANDLVCKAKRGEIRNETIVDTVFEATGGDEEIELDASDVAFTIVDQGENWAVVLAEGAAHRTVAASVHNESVDESWLMVWEEGEWRWCGAIVASTTPETANSSFEGLWINDNPNTKEISQIGIRDDADSLFVHVWDACHSPDCDWGEVKTQAATNSSVPFGLSWDKPSIRREQVFALTPDGKLQLIEYIHLTEDSGQSDTYDVQYFVKQQDRCLAFLDSQDWERIIDCYEKIAIHQPDDFTAQANLARAHVRLAEKNTGELQQAHIKEAALRYGEALSLNPQNATVIEEYARMALLLQSDCDHALELFDRAVELKPDSASLYFDRGESYKFCGEEQAESDSRIYYEQARDSFLAGLEIQPDNTRRWLQVIELYIRLREPEETMAAYNKMIAIDNDIPQWQIAYSMTQWFFEAGDLERALNFGEIALETAPSEHKEQILQLMNIIDDRRGDE